MNSDIIKKLKVLGINKSSQLFDKDIDDWRAEKFVEIKNKYFGRNKKIELELIKINQIHNDLSVYSNDQLINFLKEREKNQRELREKNQRELREKNERELREKNQRELREKNERELREKNQRELREKNQRELREKNQRELKEKQKKYSIVAFIFLLGFSGLAALFDLQQSSQTITNKNSQNKR